MMNGSAFGFVFRLFKNVRVTAGRLYRSFGVGLVGAAAMGGGEHKNNATFFINLIEKAPRPNPVSPCIGMPTL